MRILFLTHVLPYPLDSGAKVRAYYVMRWLAERHEVTLLSFVRPSDRAESVAHLRRFLANVHTVPIARGRRAELGSIVRSAMTGAPHTVARDVQAPMLARARELAREHRFDAVHADQLAMAAYALESASVSDRRPRLVLDAHNAYYLIPQRLAAVSRNRLARWYYRREARLLAHHESATYATFDHVLTVSTDDLTHIRALMPRGSATPAFSSIPICIDPSSGPISRQPAANGILILGGLHWPPNADGALWFAAEVFPRVLARMSQARLFVVGARPPAPVRAFGDARGALRPDQSPHPVLVTGYVDDPRPFIEASALLAVPLRSGGGMRVKIIEAMGWGLPVVSTAVGAEGIDLTIGEHALIADDAEGLADSIVRLLADPELAARLSRAGRRLVETHYDWRARYGALGGVYDR